MVRKQIQASSRCQEYDNPRKCTERGRGELPMPATGQNSTAYKVYVKSRLKGCGGKMFMAEPKFEMKNKINNEKV